jgi:ribonuclease Z
MAGAFATRINARRLVLNHFSARYAGDDDVDEEAKKIMIAIADLAATEYRGEIVCARDLMTIEIPLPR